MNILIACEESQRVLTEFLKLGHNVFSCDLVDTSGGFIERHIKSDVVPLLNGRCKFITCDGLEHYIDGKWDMIIAFPPCTHLAVSGARWFEKKRETGEQLRAIDLFSKILNADCEKIIVENPVNIIGSDYIKKWYPQYKDLPNCTQVIQPWYFGDKAQKTTCLWIKGVAPLVPEITEKPVFEYWTNKEGTRRMEKWAYNIRCKTTKNGLRATLMSKTFPGVARAMGEQWGSLQK